MGYIISAENYESWVDKFSHSLLSSASSLIREKGIESTLGYIPFSSQYPAHLHIDILPGYQRMGIGHGLMDALMANYRKKGVKGVMLGVDPNNIKGISFYKKYGFTPLDTDCIWWGIKP